MKVHVDAGRCQGHTLCAMIAPDSFVLSDVDGCASAVSELVAPDQQELVIEAARSCPEQAITVDESIPPSTSPRNGQREKMGTTS
ncbi:ferredoxin [Mycolicibacterium diernhoferi]|uniref:Ferredoxin n=1 Tax=Mycolicibacterium diernhoferi TaxID=1801 RepID=A0A1Q4HLI7_9MYCO|nr:ferredoxin [Mycolicibacterium diernhoferi]OPE47607.1 ferredoxin [Mycolicibacterium diernhoferi]PEG52779.1 ferredoxin [Mycolicibacterium diernhoferi]QYL21115.1 ferredoxin [Mycolicibacterium diernhoferi]